MPNPDPNHTHADFAVWVEGEKLSFTDEKFMSGISTDEHTHDEEGEYRHKYLHLHDGIGHVIHRHKPGLTLREFLRSIGMEWVIDTSSGAPYINPAVVGGGATDPQIRLRLFVNEEEIEPSPGTDILEYIFEDNDKILITDAIDEKEVGTQLDAMTDDACLYSKTCPWRGDPPTENCIADPEVPCVLEE